VDAAYRVLSERGSDAATIKEIAHAAGVAPGLVHYYFAGKEELLIGVLRAASERYTAEMAALAAQIPPADLPAAALDEPRRRALRQPAWYRLRYELFGLGLREPALRDGVAALLASGRRGIAAVVQRALPDHAPEAEALAGVLLACFDGLALQHLVDPTFDLDLAYQALAGLLDFPKQAD
jgi:AcrR family transcriptional regulator